MFLYLLDRFFSLPLHNVSILTWAVSSLCWRWIHLPYMVGIYRRSYVIVYFPLHLHQFSLLVKVVFNVGFATRSAVLIKHSFFVSCTSHATIRPPQIIKTTTQRWGDIATVTEKSPNTIVEYGLWNTNTCILGRMYLTVKYIFKHLRGFNLYISLVWRMCLNIFIVQPWSFQAAHDLPRWPFILQRLHYTVAASQHPLPCGQVHSWSTVG